MLASGLGKKGFTKKSIFKTPENTSGRVGVGTCGVGGQKMTEYTMAANKHRRGNWRCCCCAANFTKPFYLKCPLWKVLVNFREKDILKSTLYDRILVEKVKCSTWKDFLWSILIYRLNNWETGKENVRFLCILQIQLVYKSKLGIITGQLDICGNLDAFFKRWFVTGWAE